jgi:hypothetical protein
MINIPEAAILRVNRGITELVHIPTLGHSVFP